MSKYNLEDLINFIKEQVQAFISDGGEFYPFGTCIDKYDKLVPVSAFSEQEFPSPLELISVLENNFRERVITGEFKVAAIVTDVTIKEDGLAYNAIEIRMIELGREEHKEYIKYYTNQNLVEFV